MYMVGNLLDSCNLQLDSNIDVDELALTEEVGNWFSIAVEKFDGCGKLARRDGGRLLLQEILDACR